jgi:bacillithiol biosynthesis cysteine-adding enzyme BshC
VEQDVACPAASAKAILRTESVPFADIPGQSKLFLDYQRDPLALKNFYPSVVASHTEIADRIPEVLVNYSTDRAELCDALEEINRSNNAGEKTFANIALLREPDCVAVLTGQQAGLFTGPLYTIYKALSTVKEAECLRARGHKAVPIFWIATEDHDFAEVDEAVVLDSSGELIKVRSGADHTEGSPVGNAKLNTEIIGAIDSLFASVRHTEFTAETRAMVESAFVSGETFGSAFGNLLAALTSRFGLIIADPMQPTLKRLAAPIYVAAIGRSKQMVDAVLRRTKQISAAGYEPQVAVTEDYFPLFWHSDDGQRLALRSDGKGTVRAKGVDRVFSLEELASLAATSPERFSPNVMLRAAVQDFIFPTVCYFGGGAEIAYFAQNSEVYRCLDRPVTPILHRQSFSVIEAKHQRTMQSYELSFADLFQGLESLLPQIVDQFLDRKTAQTFADVEESINTELNRLDRELSAIDAGLAANLATRRRKILYHISALHKKFRAVEIRKDETVNRRINSMFNSLLPQNGLQERSLNLTYFINSYGPNFIDWVYDAIDLDDRGHRLIYL